MISESVKLHEPYFTICIAESTNQPHLLTNRTIFILFYHEIMEIRKILYIFARILNHYYILIPVYLARS